MESTGPSKLLPGRSTTPLTKRRLTKKRGKYRAIHKDEIKARERARREAQTPEKAAQKAERDLYQFVYEEAVAHAEHKKALRDPVDALGWSYSQERKAKKAERDALTKARRSARIAEQAAQYPFKALHYRAQQVATEAMFAAYKTVYHEVANAEAFVQQNEIGRAHV